MSKGLDELREIELKWQYGVFTFVPDFEVIKKELKDYATLCEELGVALSLYKCQNVQDWISMMKKKLNALEILKNKEVDVKAFKDLSNLEEYNYYCSPELTSDEYDLLKEILR